MADDEAPTNGIQSGRLMHYVERLERLAAEKGEIADQEKVVMAEAKAEGFTPKYVRAVIKLRKLSRDEIEDDEAMTSVYKSAAGLDDEAPLFRRVGGLGVDAAARDEVIEALKLLAPPKGEFRLYVPGAQEIRIYRDRKGEPKWAPVRSGS